MSNILITGGAGFIGSRLALKLKKKGNHVTVFDNLSKQIHGTDNGISSPLFLSIKEQVKFFRGDVTSERDWLSIIHNQDAIVHLAAETGTGQSMYEIRKYVDTNIRGTAIMLDILANTNHSVKKIVVASSRAVYGEGKYLCKSHGVVFPNQRDNDDLINRDFECKCPFCKKAVKLLPTSEDSRLNPGSVYGITKQNQEQMALSIGRASNIPTVALRYQNVYGPGQSLSNPYTGILSIFSTRIMNGNEINIFEDGRESRDFVYIDDVVEATTLALNDDALNNHILNVGGGKPIDVLSVAELLKRNYEVDVKIKITGNYRIGDIRHNYADLSKINSILGYQPKVSFEDGIRKFCDWVKTQDVSEDLYNKSIAELQNKGLYK